MADKERLATLRTQQAEAKKALIAARDARAKARDEMREKRAALEKLEESLAEEASKAGEGSESESARAESSEVDVAKTPRNSEDSSSESEREIEIVEKERLLEKEGEKTRMEKAKVLEKEAGSHGKVDKVSRKNSERRGKTMEKSGESSESETGSEGKDKVKVKATKSVAPSVVRNVTDILRSAQGYSNDYGKSPKEFLKSWKRARENAVNLYGIDGDALDKVCIVVLTEKLPSSTNVGAWFNNWRDKSENHSWISFMEAFKAKFMTIRKERMWKKEFLKRKEKADESPEEFLSALRELAEVAGADEETLAAQFQEGLLEEIRAKIEEYEFEEIEDMVHKAEILWEIKKREENPTSKKQDIMMVKSSVRCHNCGGFGHFQADCPSQPRKERKHRDNPRYGYRGKKKYKPGWKRDPAEVTCFNCNKKGHYASSCPRLVKTGDTKFKFRGKDRNPVKRSTKKEDSSSESSETSMVAHRAGEDLVFAEVKIGGKEITVGIDSQATTSIVHPRVINGMIWKPIEHDSAIRGYGSYITDTKWGIADINIGGRHAEFTLGISDALGDHNGIIGLNVLMQMGAIIDLKKMKLMVDGGKAVTLKQRKIADKGFIFIARDVNIPEKSGTWIKGEVNEKLDKVFVQPLPSLDDSFAVEGVYEANRGSVNIPVMNAGETAINLRSGSKIATWEQVKPMKGVEGVFLTTDEAEAQYKKEELEQQMRESQRKLITDEEFTKYLDTKAAHLNDTEKQYIMDNLFRRFRRVFMRRGELPVTTIKYPKVHLVVEGEPVVAKTRQWSEEQSNMVKELVTRLRAAGISRNSKSPWRSEPVLVDKDDGSKRLTMNYAPTVNPKLVFDAYPTPRIDEQIRKMEGCDVFSSTDANNGYFQLGLDIESRAMTAYRTHDGLDELDRLTMGMNISGAEFCRAVDATIMNKLTDETRRKTANYIDEFLCGGKWEQEKPIRIKSNLDRFIELFERFDESDWRVTLDKTEICVREIEWVGTKFSSDGVAPTMDRIKAVLDSKEPESVTEVRSFLGICNGVARKIKDYNIISKPLRKLVSTKRTKPFRFGEKARVAWTTLKNSLVTPPVMKLVDPKSPVQISVYTDASKIGIGAILTQGGHYCGFFSRTLKPRERDMAPLDRELMACAEGLEYFKFDIAGAPVELKVDHEPLVKYHQLAVDEAPGRPKKRYQWIETIGKAKPTVIYVPGSKNISDPMSRKPFVGFLGTEVMTQGPQIWKERQREDGSEVMPWVDYLEAGKLPNDKKLAKRMVWEKNNHEVDEGVVKRIWKPHAYAGKIEERWLIVVPKKYQTEILKVTHDDSGHCGPAAMCANIRNAGFIWEGYYGDSKRYKKECPICQKFEPLINKHGLLEPNLMTELHGKEVLLMDYIGPFPQTSKANTYILLSVTMADMWPEADAQKEQSTDNVVEHLIKRQASEGCWDIIGSDRGSVFISAGAEAFYESMGIEKKSTTSYNHMGVGGAEAKVKDLQQVMKKLIEAIAEDRKLEWDDSLVIHTALMFIRNRMTNDTKISPFEMRRGRPMRLPAYLRLGAMEPVSIKAKQQQDIMERARELADIQAKKQKERYDKGRVQANFKVGDYVWIKNHEVHKLEAEKFGPFRVVEKVSELNYRVGECGFAKLNNKHPVINVKFLDRYEGHLPEDKVEYHVEEIVGHRKDGRNYWFEVKWDDGSITEQPFEDLVDEEDGKRILNQALAKYAKQHKIKLA